MNKYLKAATPSETTETRMPANGQATSWTKRPSLTSNTPKTRRAKTRFYH